MTNIQVEDVSDIKKKIVVEVPPETVAEMLDAEYRDLKKTVQVKGFRRGKVPLEILRSYFREKVEADATRKIIEQTFEPGLEEKKITAVSVIKIEPESVQADKAFRYTAEIEVPPPIEVKDYKGLKLKKYLREVEEDQVDQRLQNLRERHATLSPIPDKRGIKDDDHVVADIKARQDGREIPDLTVSDYHLELGRDFYVPGFDEKIQGLTVGETSQVHLDLPDDFPRKNLAGKAVDFSVTVKEAKERVMPELDDDFAKDLGEYKNLEELKESIRKEMQVQLEERSTKEIEDQIIDALIEKHSFDVPESMVEKQIDLVLDRTRQSFVNLGLDPSRLPTPGQAERDQVRPSATRTVKAGLILNAIAEKEDVEISDEDLEAAIKKRAEELSFSVDYLKDQLEEHNVLEDMRSSLRQQKVFDVLKDSAEIVEEKAPSSDESQEEEVEKE
ncbi:MAG: trigger factor [Deltaproteobacteria bacterium]